MIERRVVLSADLASHCSPPFSSSLSGFFGTGGAARSGFGIAEDIVAEPDQIVLHHRPHGFGLGDAVPVALVHDHLDRHAAVLESLAQLIAVRDRHPAVELAVLDERRRRRLLDVGHGRSLGVDRRVGHGVGPQVLDRERRDVGVVVVGRPIGDPRADRDGLERFGRCRQECRDIAALAPTHAADTARVDPALFDQIRRHPRGRPKRRRRRGCDS